MTKPIPDGYHTMTPYLTVKGADRALDFYAKAFGAKELVRMPMGDKVGHAEMQIGDSRFMLGEEMAEMGALAPSGKGRTPVALCLYVENVDATFKQAIAAGASQLRAVENQFYGDRSGMLTDPFGHTWNVSTHIEDVSPEEMRKRMAAMPKPG
jgi:PhnB protein